jgi:hypothetical protein
MGQADDRETQRYQASRTESGDEPERYKGIQVGGQGAHRIREEHDDQRAEHHGTPVNPVRDEGHQDGRRGQSEHFRGCRVTGTLVVEANVFEAER